MLNGELNFNGIIGLERFMVALRYLGSRLKSDDVWLLAELSKCGSIEEEEEIKSKYIAFQQFLRSLRKALPEVNDLF
jgi:hypothetical protein